MGSNQNIQRASELLRQAATLLSSLGVPSDSVPSQLQSSMANSSSTTNSPDSLNSGHPNSGFIQHANFSASNTSTPDRRNSFREFGPTPSSSSARSPNFALAEVRNLFQPYARSGTSDGVRGNIRGRSNRASGTRNQERTWGQKFFCLSGPSEDRVPSPPMKLLLANAGLGLEVLELSMSMGSQEIQSLIRQKYPGLNEAPQFELLAPTGGGRTALLIRISNSEPVPNGAYLYVAQRRDRVLYIRPSIVIFQVPGESPNTDTSDIVDMGHSLNVSVSGDDSIETDSISVSSVLSPSTFSEGQGIDTIDDFVTMEDLRRRMYSENPGTQPLHVSRDNFEMQVLGVYKHPSFRIFSEPDVTFIGEFGADASALMREYFWMGFTALGNGKYMGTIPIFEGENDHKIPNSDAVLLRNSIFNLVGKFMVHCSIHTGIAFVGLSKVVSDYVLARSPSLDSGFQINIQDVADNEVREVLLKLETWDEQIEPEETDMAQINSVASQAEISMKIQCENRLFAYDQILYHFVIQKRKSQLDAIRNQFENTPILTYLQERPFLTDSVFPRLSDMVVPVQLVLRRIELLNPAPEKEVVFNLLKTILTEVLESDPSLTMDLLKAWTGWPLLPDGSLKVTIGGDFCVHACSFEMVLPENSTPTTLRSFIRALVAIGPVGFGTL